MAPKVLFRGPKAARQEMAAKMAQIPKAAGGFDFPTTPVGTSKWLGSDGKPVTIYYDPATGAAGQAAAMFILANIDALMAFCDATFGLKGQGGNVIIAAVNGQTNGDGGAYHYGCDFASGGTWYEDVSPNTQMVLGLVMAEVCESYMGFAGKGWNCGGSGGEGLSRLLAEIASGGPSGALGGFSTGDSYDGTTDWISKDEGTDQDDNSIGCSILFLYWLLGKSYTIAQIVQAGEPDGTLATTYATLTGEPATAAFTNFKAALAAIGWKTGGNLGDNPWKSPLPSYPGSGTPTPVPPGPTPVPPGPTPVPPGPTPVPPGPAPTGPTEAQVIAAIDRAFARLAASLPAWSRHIFGPLLAEANAWVDEEIQKLWP